MAQLGPSSAGSLAWALAVLRDVAWFGDQGVTVFFLLSGFGLAYGAAATPGAVDVPRFYGRRLARLYPTWWGRAPAVLADRFLDRLGSLERRLEVFRELRGTSCVAVALLLFSPAWWYVGTLIQLYLVFPALYRVALVPRRSRARRDLVRPRLHGARDRTGDRARRLPRPLAAAAPSSRRGSPSSPSASLSDACGDGVESRSGAACGACPRSRSRRPPTASERSLSLFAAG